MCSEQDCEREVNRDGLCLVHKLKTIRTNTEHLRKERNGEDVTGGMGTRRYVEDFYNKRRAAGLHDLEPANKEAARYVPKTRPSEHKKLKEINNGL